MERQALFGCSRAQGEMLVAALMWEGSTSPEPTPLKPSPQHHNPSEPHGVLKPAHQDAAPDYPVRAVAAVSPTASMFPHALTKVRHFGSVALFPRDLRFSPDNGRIADISVRRATRLLHVQS